MANTKEIKNRIGSIQETRKITNAMYLIASTKLRKTKAALDDPKRSLAVDLFMKGAIATVKELALDKIRLVGAEGKAAV